MTASMILEHLSLVVAALIFAVLAGVPLGILCHFYPAARKIVLRVVDLIQTTPALALLGIIMVFIGPGKPTVIVGLALYSLLPIVRNTCLGLQEVDPGVKEAARGMGMSKPYRVLMVEFPLAFPTVFTSGTILSSAAFLIGKISTEAAIVGIGECISRGTLISMFLVMFILPQILLVGDIIVEKTSFKLKAPVPAQRTAGTVYVNGRVRGRINGVVDANVHGVVHGEISALVGSGTIEKLPEEDPSDDDQAQDEETNGK